METIRLFTAIDVPQSLKTQIIRLPNIKLDFLSRTHPDDLHITLKFLGDVDRALLPAIEERLGDVKKPASFGLEVSGLGLFGKKDKAVLYAAIPSVRKIGLLQEAITQKLEKTGLVLEQKSYVPHVTVARLKDDRNFTAYQKQYGASIRAQWNVTTFHLMQSAGNEDGAKRYKILETYTLPAY